MRMSIGPLMAFMRSGRFMVTTITWPSRSIRASGIEGSLEVGAGPAESAPGNLGGGFCGCTTDNQPENPAGPSARPLGEVLGEVLDGPGTST